MPDRSEEDKILKAPITVILGGMPYEVPPLVIAESRKWRAKFVEFLGQYPKLAKITTDSPEFSDALNNLLVVMPEQVIDLFFDYAKGLDRQQIEQQATDAELTKAFEQVVKLAFPLVTSLAGAIAKMSP